MSKITLTNLVNLQNETTAVNAINANNAVVTTAIDNTLSRNGTAPNQMGATLDMNSNRIINLPAADSGDQPIRKAEFDLIANTTPTTKTFLGTNNEINIATNVNQLTWSLPSTLNLTGKSLTNGAFTGTPTAPTASLGTNTTQLATTAFVLANASSISTTSSPFLLAWDHGVPGDTGGDMTVALQALLDSAKSGTTIYFRGAINTTFIDLSNRKNLTLKSADVGSYAPGGGYTERATFVMNTGAVGADVPAVKCWNSSCLTFESISIISSNPAFNGTLVSWGPAVNAGEYSFLPKMRNVILSTGTSPGVVMSMYGSSNGSFRDVVFGGPGCHLKLQDNSYLIVGFVNCHLFDTCSFLPSGVTYPVQGSCNSCTFLNCLWEPGSDGRIRAISTSANRPFDGLTIIGSTIIDATVGGIEAMVFPWGAGLTIMGGSGGSPTGFMFALGGGGIAHGDPEIRGLKGVTIQGFSASGVTAVCDFYGTKANKTNTRGLKMFGNSVITGTLIGAGSGEVENGELGPNNIYGTVNAPGNAKFYLGWPTYVDRATAVAAGLISGQMFIAGGAGGGTLQVV